MSQRFQHRNHRITQHSEVRTGTYLFHRVRRCGITVIKTGQHRRRQMTSGRRTDHPDPVRIDPELFGIAPDIPDCSLAVHKHRRVTVSTEFILPQTVMHHKGRYTILIEKFCVIPPLVTIRKRVISSAGKNHHCRTHISTEPGQKSLDHRNIVRSIFFGKRCFSLP